ncbi:MAG: hypothetical protein IJX62_09685 [Clostridia bacterium]|nr:hypothetical protein [Clostridia bacterium]
MPVAQELGAENAGKYDFVILQEQSLRPVTTGVGKFYDGVRALSQKIKDVGGPRALLHVGKKDRLCGSCNLQHDNESMTWKLAAAYGAIGEELDIPVAQLDLRFLTFIPIRRVSSFTTTIFTILFTQEAILRRQRCLQGSST